MNLKFNYIFKLGKMHKCPYCLTSVSKMSSIKKSITFDDPILKSKRNINYYACHNSNCPSHTNDPEGLPDELFETGSKIISLAGGSLSGKTHYIVQALSQFIDNGSLLAKKLNITGYPIEDGYSSVKFNDYRNSLYTDLQPIIQTDVADPEQYKPIIFITKINKGNTVKTTLLSLWDTSGEEFSKLTTLKKNHSNLHNADGIILLIDPFHITEIYEEVKHRLPNLNLPHCNSETVVQNLGKLLYQQQKAETLKKYKDRTIPQRVYEKLRSKVNKPIAICLTKGDMMSECEFLIPFPQQTILDFEQVYNSDDNQIDWELIDDISEKVKSFLERQAPQMMTNLREHFNLESKNVRFFNMYNFTTKFDDDKVITDIKPKGVLFPLLWLYRKFNLL